MADRGGGTCRGCQGEAEWLDARQGERPFTAACIDTGVQRGDAPFIDHFIETFGWSKVIGLGYQGQSNPRLSYGVLDKPLRGSALYQVLCRFIGEEGTAPLSSSVRHTFVDTAPLVTARRVLIVEDNIVNQKVASRLLEKFGVTCDIANHGLEALDRLAVRDYDLVFMDCQMPKMDGYQATREIRAQELESDKRTNIVALTAHALEGEEERCREAGMDGFLTKPIRLAELRKVMDEYMPEPVEESA